MKLVQKGNKQLRVADDRLKDMLDAGFFEVDEKTGKPVAVQTPETEVDILKRENTALKRKNGSLERENSALKQENTALRTKISDLEMQVQALQPIQGEQ